MVAKVLREEEKGGSYVSHQGCKGESVVFSGKLSENNMPKLHQDELWFCKGRPSEFFLLRKTRERQRRRIRS